MMAFVIGLPNWATQLQKSCLKILVYTHDFKPIFQQPIRPFLVVGQGLFAENKLTPNHLLCAKIFHQNNAKITSPIGRIYQNNNVFTRRNYQRRTHRRQPAMNRANTNFILRRKLF